MKRGIRTATMAGLGALVTLSLIAAAGCGKKDDANSTGTPGGTSAGMGPGSSGGPGGPGGGPGRMGRGPGGRGGPVSATATGAEIYQQKCQGCHGSGGAGGRAPVLTASSGKSDDALFKIIHDGKEKMPAFASQLTDDQIKKVVTEIKGFAAK